MRHNAFERKLAELVETEVKSLGFTFWGLSMASSGKKRVIRIFIDGPEGVNIDDCAKVSRQVDIVLEAEDIIPGAFTLEVSSPGLERRFFTLDQLGDYVNRTLDVHLAEPIDGRRHFKGKLVAVTDTGLEIECDGEPHRLDWDDVREATLVHEF
ncbi:ribosome maturation factor RimP [Pseudodesulfovibrio senegalensis]|jgi:ribosome maturation factor RimP|uniref:Ribosome maturation factor RimP n=1 Tax=Pseudodesulfovibrio senegalensis TaxID=1721087 RepID=A0A6N6MXU5_9BACT|nr:ribosome maturation factor RimP [Pseudodesulfovibrio senegalensis]KAB1440244.1 ribosome maturation factor RimP [Pseudodesulfovibrio senegalensis]